MLWTRYKVLKPRENLLGMVVSVYRANGIIVCSLFPANGTTEPMKWVAFKRQSLGIGGLRGLTRGPSSWGEATGRPCRGAKVVGAFAGLVPHCRCPDSLQASTFSLFATPDKGRAGACQHGVLRGMRPSAGINALNCAGAMPGQKGLKNTFFRGYAVGGVISRALS
jgi:hypothetical protein